MNFPSLDKEGWREAPGWFDLLRPYLSLNFAQNALQIRHDLAIFKPHYPQSQVDQIRRPFGILLLGGFAIVNGPIEFNHQLGGRAVKIGDKRANTGLASEFQTVQLAVFQGLPKADFSGRHRRTEFFTARFQGLDVVDDHGRGLVGRTTPALARHPSLFKEGNREWMMS